MVSLPRALLLQQLVKLGAAQSPMFVNFKATMPTPSEALPGNNYCTNATIATTTASNTVTTTSTTSD